MSFGSQKLVHTDGTMHHLGIDAVTPRVICTSLETPWAPGGPARIARWAELGVSALDGETSALFVLASILGIHAASLAYLAENYATGAAAPMDAQARGRLFTAAAEALRCC